MSLVKSFVPNRIARDVDRRVWSVRELEKKTNHRTAVAAFRPVPGRCAHYSQHAPILSRNLHPFPRRESNGVSAEPFRARVGCEHLLRARQGGEAQVIEIVGMMIVAQEHNVEVKRFASDPGSGDFSKRHRPCRIYSPQAGSNVGSVNNRKPPSSSSAVGPPDGIVRIYEKPAHHPIFGRQPPHFSITTESLIPVGSVEHLGCRVPQRGEK